MVRMFVLGADPVPADCIMDAVAFFNHCVLQGDEIERKIIRDVESGKYVSSTEFEDRNGCRLPMDMMSTSCRVALSACHSQGRAVSCVEACDSALEAILRHVPDVSIVVPDRFIVISDRADVRNSILYRGHVFSSVREFSSYMLNDWTEVSHD